MTAHNDTADTFIIPPLYFTSMWSIKYHHYLLFPSADWSSAPASLPLPSASRPFAHTGGGVGGGSAGKNHFNIQHITLLDQGSSLGFCMMTGYGEFDHSSVRAFEGPIFSCNLVYNGDRKTNIPIDPPSFYTWQPALLPDETLRVLRLATREK